ncbi:MAG: ester cyclase [Cyanobacteria bacterium J06554_3]
MFHELLSTQNRALVLRFYRAFDQRRLREGLSLLSPELVAHMAGQSTPLTYEEFAAVGSEVYSAFPDGQHRFDCAIARKDMVTTVGTFTGTHLGTFQGLPATGKRISFSVMHIDRVHHSKIVEHWGQGDSLSLVQQLGIKLVPGPSLAFKMGVKAGKHLTGDTFEKLRSVTQPDYYPQVPEY